MQFNPSPAVDMISRNKRKKKLFCFFNILNENDVEVFGIMVRQSSSAQYALYFIEIG